MDFLNQSSDLEGLDKKLCTGPQIAYWGTDPTDDSIHIGNLASLTMLRWCQKTGNKPSKSFIPSGKCICHRYFWNTKNKTLKISWNFE